MRTIKVNHLRVGRIFCFVFFLLFKVNAVDKQYDYIRDIIYNDLEKIQRSWHQDTDLTHPNIEKSFRYAVEDGKSQIVEFFLEKGVNPNPRLLKTDPTGWDNRTSYLSRAACKGHDRVVEVLLNAGVPADIEERRTALSWSIMHGNPPANPRIVNLLLDHGAKISLIDNDALEWMTENGYCAELEILLNSGLDPNTEVNSKTLLDRAVRRSYREESALMAIELINRGANIGTLNEKGQSFLYLSKNDKLSEVLIQKGLNIHAKDLEGRTPIEHRMLSDCCYETKVIETLCRYGANPQSLCLFRFGVIQSAWLVKQAIASGANVNEVNANGFTPLRQAANKAFKSGVIDSIEVLLQNGADVNYQPKRGCWTALHEAFSQNQGYVNFSDDALNDAHVEENSYTKAILLLIKFGAKPLKDISGRTPLMTITHNGFSVTYCNSLIRRFYKFEAEYYNIDPELYLKGIYDLRQSGYTQISGVLADVTVPIKSKFDAFWKQMGLPSLTN